MVASENANIVELQIYTFDSKLYFYAILNNEDSSQAYVINNADDKPQLAPELYSYLYKNAVVHNDYYYYINQDVLYQYNKDTQVYKEIYRVNANGINNLNNLTLYNGKIYFSAYQGRAAGTKLMEYDSNTDIVASIVESDIVPYYPINMIVNGGLLYFVSSITERGQLRLWSYNNKTNVLNIYDNDFERDDFTPFDNLIIYDNTIYISTERYTGNHALLYLNPNNKLVTFVADISIETFHAYNDKLYLSASDEDVFGELFVYDALLNQVDLVKDIFYKESGSNPHDLIVANNHLLFSANDGAGDKRYKFDGDTEQLTVIGDADQPVTTFNCADHNPTEYNGKFYFSYSHDLYGEELFYCESLDSDTPILALDLNPGAVSSNPKGLIVYDHKLYFWATDDEHGMGIFSYDSNKKTTKLIIEFEEGEHLVEDQHKAFFNVINNKLTFVINKWGGYGGQYSEIRTYNSTNSTSETLLRNGPTNQLISYLGVYYMATQYTDCDELVVNCFTSYFLKSYDFDKGYQRFSLSSSNEFLGNLIIYMNKLYFTKAFARDGDYEGAGGTDGLYNYNFATDEVELTLADSNTYHYTVVNDYLYAVGQGNGQFYAVNAITGKIRYFKNDAFSTSAFRTNKISYQGALYFSADDGHTGYELYRLLPNQPPVIEGDTQLVYDEASESRLSSLTVFDPEHDELTFLWQQVSGTDVTFDNNTLLAPSFTTPDVTQDETLVFELTVSDGLDDVKQQVTVLVKHSEPPTVVDDKPNSEKNSSGGSVSWLTLLLWLSIYYRKCQHIDYQ